MSPKIYFIQNSDGKFYNSRDKYYYSSLTNANYERSRSILDELIKIKKFDGCNVYETTEEQFMEELATATTDLVIAGAYFNQLLENFACKVPTISQVNKTMYQKCKVAIDVIKPFSEMHKSFLKAQEETTDDVSGHFSEYIKTIGNIKIYQTGEIISILNAYQKDRSSIIGIAKKILNFAKRPACL